MSAFRPSLAAGFAKLRATLIRMRLVVESANPYDTACYPAQQVICGQPFPYTHDLEELERLSQNIEPLPEPDPIDLVELTGYAVGMRYDFEQWPGREETQQAMQTAEQVLPTDAHVLVTRCISRYLALSGVIWTVFPPYLE